MRRAITLCAALLLVVLSAGTATAAPANAGGTRVDVIVVLDHGDPAQVARSHDADVSFIYSHALNGFAASVPEGRLTGLRNDRRVDYVESDDPVSIVAQTVPTGIDRIFATGNTSLSIDGIDNGRVDVDVAIIDTGIDFEHPDLDVVGGVTCQLVGNGPPWARSSECTPGGDDDHYHGTHVAGTVGAIDDGVGVVGVAPGARLWAAKVLDSSGSGYESQVVAGIDWVTANASTIEVANMSLGGSGHSQAEYDAIQGAVDGGVAFAVAAGNSDDNADNYSPGGFDNVLSVSALADFDGAPGGNGSPTCRSDQDDTLADFSNWGPEIDITAPGVCILSTYPIEQGSYGTISGTSMASPHVAGALALLASQTNPDNATDVASLYGQVVNTGNFDWTDDSGDNIHEPLLDMSTFDAAMVGGNGGDAAPTVTLTNPTDGSTVAGTVTVTADATDDNTVTQVEFFVDGASIGTDTNSIDGWSASWNTTTSADGVSTVSATATDDAAQTDTDSVSVNVDNVDDPPSVAVTNPTEGSTVSGTVTVTADASDDNAVTNVEFFIGGTSIGTDTDSNDGWSASWDTTPLSDGTSYSISAIATDSASQPTSSSTVNATVDNSAPALTASVSYDRFGGRFSDKHLGITITVTDGGGPVSGVLVDIKLADPNGNVLTGTGTTSSDGTVRFEVKNAAQGCWTTDVTSLDGTPYTADDDSLPSTC